ncbi:RND efflux system, outer membrane lipoprotein CmeC [Marinobacterium lacunae]|uniref:RND efflux system, outer membrane lipoprotein CmeC n=1 Tax=Marinobacterium lacunae TaxID=1232683 RepID=A0A081FXU1_9GAMM|nr:efflux transporter outer membrane subunit [Marinobacterium lacunae]KEA63346.1 RND efflux system, outer membrane lipoprotein CmeC [Marinobacterium lacunae]
MKVIPLALTIALLGGCSLIPDYQQPQVDSINTWQDGQPATLAAADTGWRDIFTDPALLEVISQSLENNKDLNLALLNVDRYRAQYRIQRAELLPSIEASGSGTRQRLPQTYNSSGQDSISSSYSATVGLASYELDLFGRVRSLKQQALENYLAQEQNLRATQITLVANVTNAYLNWVADRELLTLAEQTLAIEADNLSLVKQRFDLGVASELELSQAQAALEDANVTLARYRRLGELDRSALTLLVGAPLGAQWNPADKIDPHAVADVAPGIPSELLTRRPDILAAEHQLKGANANIGAARAAYFPSISLTANAGSMSRDLSNLFEAGSGSWSFMPSISLPIFNAGRLDAELDTAKIDRDIALTQYQQAVQSAFTEVSDALTERDGYAVQLAAQERAEAAYTRYFNIADQRYHNGVDSMLTRLDAQRNLVASQQASISARLALMQAKVDLYRALGGGWQERSSTNP